MIFRFFAVAVVTMLGLVAPALADDWTAVKLRGGVFTFLDGHWQQLSRGDVVPDERVIRTQANGRVVFVRGAESIELQGDTQIQIMDGGAAGFTTVKQYFGQLAVEAEVRNVKHFEVRTPTMAAVVKGTRFVVGVDTQGTDVVVERGHVAVECMFTHWNSVISAGQSAANGKNEQLHVMGKGTLPPVLDVHGNPV